MIETSLPNLAKPCGVPTGKKRSREPETDPANFFLIDSAEGLRVALLVGALRVVAAGLRRELVRVLLTALARPVFGLCGLTLLATLRLLAFFFDLLRFFAGLMPVSKSCDCPAACARCHGVI